MTDQHRATPEQWAKCEEDARLWSGAFNCILELRARVEALEADQLEQAESNRFCVDAIVRRVEALEAAQQDKLDRLIAQYRAASAEAQPAGGLVERVVIGILPGSVDGELTTVARAAIREVAAAAKDLRFATAKALIDWLEREADRG
jgi:hypothetical protein